MSCKHEWSAWEATAAVASMVDGEITATGEIMERWCSSCGLGESKTVTLPTTDGFLEVAE